MEEETKRIMQKEDAEKYLAEVLAEKRTRAAYDYDSYDDTDDGAQDRARCMSMDHPFSYVGTLGPSCECGDRCGPHADFAPDDIARGALDLAICQHDRSLPRDGQSK